MQVQVDTGMAKQFTSVPSLANTRKVIDQRSNDVFIQRTVLTLKKLQVQLANSILLSSLTRTFLYMGTDMFTGAWIKATKWFLWVRILLMEKGRGPMELL